MDWIGEGCDLAGLTIPLIPFLFASWRLCVRLFSFSFRVLLCSAGSLILARCGELARVRQQFRR